AGSGARAEAILNRAGIDPRERGEKLDIDGFIAIARAAAEVTDAADETP
ncbi:16S rRNA (adenine(1518)-N(6)/adenine(1519)-N(6))-dimethyltransferase RsmA, partial [Glutamicibacter creatinolyticus]